VCVCVCVCVCVDGLHLNICSVVDCAVLPQERRRVQEKKDLIDSTRARLITLHTKTRADTAQAIARK